MGSRKFSPRHNLTTGYPCGWELFFFFRQRMRSSIIWTKLKFPRWRKLLQKNQIGIKGKTFDFVQWTKHSKFCNFIAKALKVISLKAISSFITSYMLRVLTFNATNILSVHTYTVVCDLINTIKTNFDLNFLYHQKLFLNRWFERT